VRWRGLVQTVEVAFEGIDVSGPELTEPSEPAVDLLEGRGGQSVETALCVGRGFDEAGLPQHAQVL